MKVINKKAEREKERIEIEKNGPAAALNRKRDKARQVEEERKALIVRVVLDWRVSGQLNPITEDIWYPQARKENFIKYAIKNRKQLKELYVEPFEYIAHGNIRSIEIECDKDTIDMLDNEARKEGLAFNEYVTSIV